MAQSDATAENPWEDPWWWVPDPPGPSSQPPPVTGNWNRLEGRPRGLDLAQALRAEVHDSLWFLTRQWQMGEFQGEDTGSAILAKIEVKNTQMNRYAPLKTDAKPYSDDIPLEARVERMAIDIDLPLSIRMGRHWLKLLDKFGQQYNAAAGTGMTAYTAGMYKALYVATLSFTIPAQPTVGDSELEKKARFFTNKKAWQMKQAAAGRSVNGAKLYKGLKDNSIVPANLIGTVPLGQAGSVDGDHQTFVTSAAAAFVEWFEKLYCLPEAGESEAWKEDQLEYQFSATIPNADNPANKTIVTADEYYSGHLDWWSFDIDGTNTHHNSLEEVDGSVNENVTSTEIITMVPTGVIFSGMPNTRWWEFEDRQVDFGNLNPNPNETAKILLAEFALVHSNNWNVIPYTIPVGSMSEVKSIVVTDVFGKNTLVEPASGGAQASWENWGLFNLNTRTQNGSVGGTSSFADSRLFLPPVIGKVQESDPIESINFLRDEMANMVWGVENIVPDCLGGGWPGKRASELLVEYLNELLGEEDTGTINENEAKLRYLLTTTVPEHWIPLIPVQAPLSNRDIRLQRAAFPRFVDSVPSTELPAVSSRTSILGGPAPPYFINEEEIPRSGALVQETWQRTRWYDGKIVLWKGRRKINGRGEGASNLVFDQVKEKGEAGNTI